MALTGWAIVELFGHRRLAGRVSEETIAGEQLLRVEVPRPDGTVSVHRHGGKAIYGLHEVTEAAARAAAARMGNVLMLSAPDDDDDEPAASPERDPATVISVEPAQLCGSCSQPLGDQPVERVWVGAEHEQQIWHARCAAEGF